MKTSPKRRWVRSPFGFVVYHSKEGAAQIVPENQRHRQFLLRVSMLPQFHDEVLVVLTHVRLEAECPVIGVFLVVSESCLSTRPVVALTVGCVISALVGPSGWTINRSVLVLRGGHRYLLA